MNHHHPAGGPDVILLARHAEKPDPHLGSVGVDRHGRADEHSLSVRGWQRAGALAALLAHAPDRAHGLLVRPERVIATKPTKHARSRREVDTAHPVADRLGLRVIDDHGHGELSGVVGAVQSETTPALVVWHHGEIPSLARHLGADPAQVPAEWPEDRYDLLWLLRREDPSQPYGVTVVALHLLAGDGNPEDDAADPKVLD